MVGSQIVGLIPLKALLDSADFYILRDQLFIMEEEHKVRLVRLCKVRTWRQLEAGLVTSLCLCVGR